MLIHFLHPEAATLSHLCMVLKQKACSDHIELVFKSSSLNLKEEFDFSLKSSTAMKYRQTNTLDVSSAHNSMQTCSNLTRYILALLSDQEILQSYSNPWNTSTFCHFTTTSRDFMWKHLYIWRMEGKWWMMFYEFSSKEIWKAWHAFLESGTSLLGFVSLGFDHLPFILFFAKQVKFRQIG